MDIINVVETNEEMNNSLLWIMNYNTVILDRHTKTCEETLKLHGNRMLLNLALKFFDSIDIIISDLKFQAQFICKEADEIDDKMSDLNHLQTLLQEQMSAMIDIQHQNDNQRFSYLNSKHALASTLTNDLYRNRKLSVKQMEYSCESMTIMN